MSYLCMFWGYKPVFIQFFVVLLSCMLHVLFPVKCNHWIPILIQEQKSPISIHCWLFLRLFAILQNTKECIFHTFFHRQQSGSTCRFCGYNLILHISGSLQLMINSYHFILEIQISHSKSTKLWNSKSRFKQRSEGKIQWANAKNFIFLFLSLTYTKEERCFYRVLEKFFYFCAKK